MSYPTTLARPQQIRSALRLYQVMAVVTGVALFVLVVAMFLRYGPPQNESFSKFWSPVHGFLYMAYAASIANLGLKLSWGVQRIVLHLLTGFVPLLPFVAERRVTAQTKAVLARLY